jgi:5-enolpyruvylshikimate-3-phosphate synthase
MSLLVLGKAAGIPVEVNDTACIDTSFPEFQATLAGLSD